MGQQRISLSRPNGRPAWTNTSPTAEPAAQYDNVHVVDRDVHAAFPTEAIAALGPRWFWFAMVGGADSIDDYCPGGAGTSLDNLVPISVG